MTFTITQKKWHIAHPARPSQNLTWLLEHDFVSKIRTSYNYSILLGYILSFHMKNNSAPPRNMKTRFPRLDGVDEAERWHFRQTFGPVLHLVVLQGFLRWIVKRNSEPTAMAEESDDSDVRMSWSVETCLVFQRLRTKKLLATGKYMFF